jgi:hypothetical protein
MTGIVQYSLTQGLLSFQSLKQFSKKAVRRPSADGTTVTNNKLVKSRKAIKLYCLSGQK